MENHSRCVHLPSVAEHWYYEHNAAGARRVFRGLTRGTGHVRARKPPSLLQRHNGVHFGTRWRFGKESEVFCQRDTGPDDELRVQTVDRRIAAKFGVDRFAGLTSIYGNDAVDVILAERWRHDNCRLAGGRCNGGKRSVQFLTLNTPSDVRDLKKCGRLIRDGKTQSRPGCWRGAHGDLERCGGETDKPCIAHAIAVYLYNPRTRTERWRWFKVAAGGAQVPYVADCAQQIGDYQRLNDGAITRRDANKRLKGILTGTGSHDLGIEGN